MNILFVSDSADSGGAENQMLEEIFILSGYIQICLITKKEPQANTILLLKNHSVIFLGTIDDDITLINKIDTFKFTFIHAHNIWDDKLLLFIKKINLPIVMTVHDYRILCPTGWKVQPNMVTECLQKNFNYCTTSICFENMYTVNTNASKSWFEKQYWLKKNVNGWAIVNNHLLNRMKEEGFENLHSVPYPMKKYPNYENRPRKFCIGYAGLLSEHKGIIRLISTIKSLSKINNNIEFIIIGEGNMAGYLKEELSSFNNIIYKGILSLSEIYSFFSICSVIYLPSKWQENFNLIGRYSRLIGTPILVPETGGFMQRLNCGISEFYNPLKTNNDAIQLYEMLKKVNKLNSGSENDRIDEINQSNVSNFLIKISLLYASIGFKNIIKK
jgi:glycosyltransferase involved in cell wall biosynthesis